jgi:SAM-dependent methyltransferase
MDRREYIERHRRFFPGTGNPIMEKIRYLKTADIWTDYPTMLMGVIQQYGCRKICDVGGGSNPQIPIAFIRENALEYSLMDISKEELDKAPPQYARKFVQDITAETLAITDRFDCIFTRMLAEHVRDGIQFHRNVYTLLNPGGVAVHFFPTLYAIPFLANKLIPDRLSSFALNILAPRNPYQRPKFRAYYRWCFGPTPRMLNMLSKTGFNILEYRAIYGHFYYRKLSLLHQLLEKYSSFLLEHKNPYLTSYAQVVLRKPVSE